MSVGEWIEGTAIDSEVFDGARLLHSMSILAQLKKVIEARETLTREEARLLMESILQGAAAEVGVAALLGAMSVRGETAAELAGFVDALRAAAVPFPLTDVERAGLVDTCGTGGDASGTFNISTAVSLVAAAAGARVAKHGNRNVTSKCGSADVLEAMGIPVGLSAEECSTELREKGFAFLLATSMHPAMKAVAPVRKALGVRTVFNVLGPMANPAGARAQVMGVYAARLVPVVAEALAMLGVRHAMVVHGGGLDEISLSGESEVAEVRGHVISLRKIVPEDAGLQPASVEALRGGDAMENAAILHGIFAGDRGACRDVVLLNAAAVLMVAGVAEDLRAGAALAAEAIDSGAVAKLVGRLRRA